MRDDEILEIDPSAYLVHETENGGSATGIVGFIAKVKACVSLKRIRENSVTLSLVLGAVVCLTIPFFTNAKFTLNGTNEDPKIIELARVGMNVYFDGDIVGKVKKVVPAKKNAVLTLDRKIDVPRDSRFWIVSDEKPERIEIERGDDKKFWREDSKVILERKENKPQEVVEEVKTRNVPKGFADRVKKVLSSREEEGGSQIQASDATKDASSSRGKIMKSIEAILQLIGACAVCGGCIVAVITFRTIKWLATIFKIGAVVSSLGILRWIPDIVAFFKQTLQ